MALVKGVNSYETLEAANTYFATRLDIAAWTDASDATRTQALVTATMLLDEEAWIGEAASDSQALAHPRNGEYFEPRLGKLAELTSAAALKRINNAQYELAYHLLNNDGLLDNIGEVDSLSIGGISLSDIRGSSKIPGIVRKLIRPLLARGNNSWWRAN